MSLMPIAPVAALLDQLGLYRRREIEHLARYVVGLASGQETRLRGNGGTV